MSVTTGRREDAPSYRAILRVVVTVTLSVLVLYVLYRVREPLGWIVLGTFVASQPRARSTC